MPMFDDVLVNPYVLEDFFSSRVVAMTEICICRGLPAGRDIENRRHAPYGREARRCLGSPLLSLAKQSQDQSRDETLARGNWAALQPSTAIVRSA